MADETKKITEEAEAKMKADAEMIDKTLKCLDSLAKRMDAWEEKMDAEEAKKKEEEDEKKKADELIDPHPESSFKTDSVRIRHDNAVAQARADDVANQWGTAAPRPLDGESTRDYKVRLLNEFRQNSPVWKDVPEAQLARLPDEVFDRAENQIYADSMAASAHPIVPEGELRTIVRPMKNDLTGRKEIVHFGRPSAWMSQFAHPRRHVKINPYPNRER
jgi:hypothetical protein